MEGTTIGQVLGLGYSAGDRQKTTSTPKLPSYVEPVVRGVADVAGTQLPYYKEMFGRMFGGDASVTSPYTARLAGSYTPGAPAYTSVASVLKPLLSAYTPVGGS